MTIEVRGNLDSLVVKAIVAVLSAADGKDANVEIDLSTIDGHDNGGVAALAEVAAGERAITFRAHSERGQAALLALVGPSPTGLGDDGPPLHIGGAGPPH